MALPSKYFDSDRSPGQISIEDIPEGQVNADDNYGFNNIDEAINNDENSNLYGDLPQETIEATPIQLQPISPKAEQGETESLEKTQIDNTDQFNQIETQLKANRTAIESFQKSLDEIKTANSQFTNSTNETGNLQEDSQGEEDSIISVGRPPATETVEYIQSRIQDLTQYEQVLLQKREEIMQTAVQKSITNNAFNNNSQTVLSEKNILSQLNATNSTNQNNNFDAQTNSNQAELDYSQNKTENTNNTFSTSNTTVPPSLTNNTSNTNITYNQQNDQALPSKIGEPTPNVTAQDSGEINEIINEAPQQVKNEINSVNEKIETIRERFTDVQDAFIPSSESESTALPETTDLVSKNTGEIIKMLGDMTSQLSKLGTIFENNISSMGNSMSKAIGNIRASANFSQNPASGSQNLVSNSRSNSSQIPNYMDDADAVAPNITLGGSNLMS